MSDEDKIRGMTVNERLFHLGLFPQFEAAARARSKPDIVAVLIEAGFTPEQAQGTASALLAAPERYGY